jgi:hypothetical protein
MTQARDEECGKNWLLNGIMTTSAAQRRMISNIDHAPDATCRVTLSSPSLQVSLGEFAAQCALSLRPISTSDLPTTARQTSIPVLLTFTHGAFNA